MPTYKYRCEKCDAKFEIIRGITVAEEVIKCPKCGTEDITKIYSAVCGAGRRSGKSNLRFPACKC